MTCLNRRNSNLKELHEEQNQRLVQICLNSFHCYPTDAEILAKILQFFFKKKRSHPRVTLKPPTLVFLQLINLNRKFSNFK